MKKTKRWIAFLLCAVLCGIVTGCVSKPAQTGSNNQPALSYALTYYYHLDDAIANGDVSDYIRQLLDSFGAFQSITPAAPVVETYTEIPKFENDAKGTEPVVILFPNLDVSKYRFYYDMATKADATTSGCYRMIGGRTDGMMTDESITYDVDSAGNITQYQTVNFGKYDGLGLDESKLENLRNTFSSAISQKIGTKLDYQYVYDTTSETVFRVFTDNADRIFITTTISLPQGNQYIDVELYALVS